MKVLFLEGIHEEAAGALSRAGYEVRILPDSPDEAALAAELRDVAVPRIRSKTKITLSLLAAAPELLVVGAYCIGDIHELPPSMGQTVGHQDLHGPRELRHVPEQSGAPSTRLFRLLQHDRRAVIVTAQIEIQTMMHQVGAGHYVGLFHQLVIDRLHPIARAFIEAA